MIRLWIATFAFIGVVYFYQNVLDHNNPHEMPTPVPIAQSQPKEPYGPSTAPLRGNLRVPRHWSPPPGVQFIMNTTEGPQPTKKKEW